MTVQQRMEFLMVIICVIPVIVTSVTISSNGNSPKTKMIGGMMVDVQNGFIPMTAMLPDVETTTRDNYEKSRTNNSTKLALNERYRRLIPYMTFYYANELTIPTTENVRNIEVEKAEIVEAKQITENRLPKKIDYIQRNIPRYQGNRLTNYNIASANPTKIFYKDGVPIYQIPYKLSPNYNPLLSDFPRYEYDSNGRIIQKPISKPPGTIFTPANRRPFINIYNEEIPNIRYYLSEKEPAPKYKLVPYEQTPPVKVPFQTHSVKNKYEQLPDKAVFEQPPPFKIHYDRVQPAKGTFDKELLAKTPQRENFYEVRKPISGLVPKEAYVRPRPVRPSFIYDADNIPSVRKQPAIISESYYEEQRPQGVAAEPVIESGFKPIVGPAEYTTEAPMYSSTRSDPALTSRYEIEKEEIPLGDPSPIIPATNTNPNYFKYVIEQPESKPTRPNSSTVINLASLLNSLQGSKSIPKPITRQNVDSSIRTLLQVLNSLKAEQHPNELAGSLLSTPTPFVAKKVVQIVKEPDVLIPPSPELADPESHEEPYLAQVNPPSQHLDDNSNTGGSSQQFPLPVMSDDEGGTPGQPGVDYPILTTIPQTSFDCKTQRYKGFFADPETRCQVWHYCDLNGGQASFLCPNGTIFSQAGLTCDWWFNVRCESTTQLYVLNESLYKYILPHSPKFPEDYSGPLVDKYLTLKFKEMEEELRKKKSKQHSSGEKDEDSDEEDEEPQKLKTDTDKRQLNNLSESSVIVETPGDSGKVQRLVDE